MPKWNYPIPIPPAVPDPVPQPLPNITLPKDGKLMASNFNYVVDALKATQLNLNITANAAAAIRVMPVSTPSSNSYIIANNDLGNIITVAAGNVYITTNSSFAPGSVMRVWNNSSSFTTITQNTGTTIYLANSVNSSVQALTGNRYISPRGLATITCVAANTFVVNGTGLT